MKAIKESIMQKLLVIIFIFFSSFLFSGCTSDSEKLDETSPSQQNAALSSPQLSTPTSISTDFTARFEIYTNGTKRIFTEDKYHRQSDDIYIENPDPLVIHVKKSDLTWNDFFSTLPFSLQKACLVTGTKQSFCNTETKKLHFYINGQEDPDALDKVISPNDMLRVEYR
jgi:hypothetical protein